MSHAKNSAVSNMPAQNISTPQTGATVALVPIARTTFDMALAEEITAQVRTQLDQTGLSITGTDALITTMDEIQTVAANLAAAPPDLLLVLQSSFADSTMLMELAKMANAPLLMWAVPEAHTGGRLRLNSLCGINLGGHALTRAGHQYDTIYAAPDDPAAVEKIQAMALAGQVRRRLHGARLGRLGEHPDGFDTCQFDADNLKNIFGLEVHQLKLAQFFEQVKATEPRAIDAVIQDLGQTLPNLPKLNQPATRGTLGTYVTLRNIAQQEQLDGFAMRCWPEFFTELGCAACGAMSLLSNNHTPCSCEVDVNGTITQLILQWMSGEPAFGSDLVSVDEKNDAIVLWHCGLAPQSMANPDAEQRGTIHSNRKLPLLMEFPLKPGRVTIARLSEATGKLRLVVGGGQMLQAPPSFSGTSGTLKFDRPAGDVLNTILSEGLEHHLSITYGDYVPALLALAKMLNIPVLRL